MEDLAIIFNQTQGKMTNPGDIYFWNHLVNHFDEKGSSINNEDFIQSIFDEHFSLTNEPLTINSMAKIKEEDLIINGKFWIDNFVSLFR